MCRHFRPTSPDRRRIGSWDLGDSRYSYSQEVASLVGVLRDEADEVRSEVLLKRGRHQHRHVSNSLTTRICPY